MTDDSVTESNQDRDPLSDLDSAQNETLQHLKEVISWIDNENALQVLRECDWDLERAVNKFLGVPSNATDDTNVRRRNTGTDTNPPAVALVPPNQRIIRVSHSESYGWWWAISMLFEPIRLTYHLLFGITRFIASFLWPDPRNQVTDAVGDVRRFINYFHATYGDDKEESTTAGTESPESVNVGAVRAIDSRSMPPFFVGSYAQALREAKQSLRFLIVYLHGDAHEDTRSFCENTLRHSEVLRFFHNSDQLILWGCNIKSPEGYRVSRTLREHTYPFIGVIGLTNLAPSESGQYSTSMIGMALLGRIEGAVKPLELIQQLQSILDEHRGATIAARLERSERETRSRIRDEQDQAFQEALEQDRARTEAREQQLRVAAEEAEQLARLAKREEALIEARATRRARWRECLPPAPAAGSPSTVQLSFKMPNGRRLSRVFNLFDSIKILYYFILSHDDSPANFEIQANFPKRPLPCKPDPESDLEDYLPSSFWETESPRKTKSLDVIDDWSPASDTDPPTFSELGLCKPEILFILDQDA